MRRIPATIRGLGLAAGTDDTSLFSTSVAPNVLLVADNSGSMEHVVWHPAFDVNNPRSRCSVIVLPSSPALRTPT